MRKKTDLPKTVEELKKLNHAQQSELWQRYADSIYVRQFRALWYYIACENANLRIESKYLTKLAKYAEAPEECMIKVTKNKYNLHPGGEIIKIFRGQEFKITITDKSDFFYNGRYYKTLSAIAKEICGIKVSGPDFF